MSLEAPLVAVLWQRLLAQALDVPLGWPQTALLGAGVWLVYAADRLLDARGGAPEGAFRHLFYRLYRLPVVTVWCGLLGLSLWLALTRLEPPELVAGAALTGFALFYLLRRHQTKGQPAKELEVGLLFGLGVGLFLPFVGAPPLPLAALLAPFTALCFVNVALIGVWEGDDKAGSLASRFPSLSRTLPVLTFALALACLVTATLGPYHPVFSAAALSALSLGLLARAHTLKPTTRHVLADAALLTPLLVGWA